MRAAVLTRARQGWNAHLVVVPVVLTLVEVIATQTELRLLLFPSLASFAYLLFTRPVGTHATWRGAVLGPSVGAAIGTLGAVVFQSKFLGVLVVTFVTMLAMRAMRVTNAPVLAVSILPLVFQAGGVEFPLSILLATAGLFLFFLAWRRTLPPSALRLPVGAGQDGATTGD
jgi:CBS-domain-containing membrane protein